MSAKSAGLLRLLGGVGVILSGIGLVMGWMYFLVRMDIQPGKSGATAGVLIIVGACVYGGKLILGGLRRIAHGQDRDLSTGERLALSKRCMKWFAAGGGFAGLLSIGTFYAVGEPALDKFPIAYSFYVVTGARFLVALFGLLISAGAYFSARSESDPCGRFFDTSMFCYFLGLLPLLALAFAIVGKFVSK